MQDLLKRDKTYLWHPYTQMLTAPAPLPIVKAKGVYLYTEDGREILDGISSWWVNIHGHSHPKLNEALANQANKLEHVLFAGCTHPPAVELAEKLIPLLPKGISRVFYSDNGSTAVEVALKMALQYWQNQGQHNRKLFIALHYAYHGDTVGSMSPSEESVFTASFQSLLFPVIRADAPYCYRCPLGLDPKTCKIDCLSSLANLLETKAKEVAGVLIEPMLQGAGGMIVWPKEFLEGVRKLCDKYNVLMIADEVFTGFGRTGKMFACEHADISPDIICLSKGLTAGYLPLAITATKESIYQAFLSEDRRKTFFHGHSYTANPLGCAVAIASLEIFQTENVLEKIAVLENILVNRLNPLKNLPFVGEVRVIGGVGILELVTNKENRDTGGYLSTIGPKLAAKFLTEGLLIRPLGNIVYFMPPYVITPEQTNLALDKIAKIITDLEKI
ncbi:MAG: adenosylmethionine--8-amino-7-oxononanoate transaminase [Acidobacteria bacterium]|nr:adenosylmethionine--8-amino-7-oxononanoate transaminase [Acidobacteriota bacterium]